LNSINHSFVLDILPPVSSNQYFFPLLDSPHTHGFGFIGWTQHHYHLPKRPTNTLVLLIIAKPGYRSIEVIICTLAFKWDTKDKLFLEDISDCSLAEMKLEIFDGLAKIDRML
jgi:hypothetical protein